MMGVVKRRTPGEGEDQTSSDRANTSSPKVLADVGSLKELNSSDQGISMLGALPDY